MLLIHVKRHGVGHGPDDVRDIQAHLGKLSSLLLLILQLYLLLDLCIRGLIFPLFLSLLDKAPDSVKLNLLLLNRVSELKDVGKVLELDFAI